MKDLCYDSVSRVLDTWEKARRTTSDAELGNLMLEMFFVLEPDAKKVIPDKHGDLIVSNMDSLFQLLGPDEEFVAEICKQVGQRHRKIGIKPAHFAHMGQSLTYALTTTLGGKFTREDHNAWIEIYNILSDEIVAAMC
jgi:ribosomal protein L32E